MGGTGSTRWKGRQVRALTSTRERIDAQDCKHARGMATVSRPSTGEMVDVALSFVPQHFGAARAWLLCPACGARARYLYVAPDSEPLAVECRKCVGLTYPSTRETWPVRSRRRIRELHARIVDSYRYDWGRRRMPSTRESTRERMRARLSAMEAEHERRTAGADEADPKSQGAG